MPLRYIDPNRRRGWLYRADMRFGQTRAGQFLGRHVYRRIDPWLYRKTGGRYPTALPLIPSAPLTTTGAKTGLPREVQLAYFHDGSDAILIASNHGGPRHPGWYYNLMALPQCRFGGDAFVATEVTDPSEHARLYALAEQVYAGYGDYRVQTAALGRRIPVVRLKPAASPNRD